MVHHKGTDQNCGACVHSIMLESTITAGSSSQVSTTANAYIARIFGLSTFCNSKIAKGHWLRCATPNDVRRRAQAHRLEHHCLKEAQRSAATKQSIRRRRHSRTDVQSTRCSCRCLLVSNYTATAHLTSSAQGALPRRTVCTSAAAAS